jgi:Mrp family chromosome partitioning ATPase
MGRMMDALERAGATRAAQAAPPPAPEEDVVLVPDDADVPFIEIGPSRSLEASAGVLAMTAAQRLRLVPPPAPEAEAAPAPSRPAAVSVSFRPLPPPAPGLSPDLIAFHQPEHPASEQYRTLAAALRHGLPAGACHVLLCAALAPYAGSTSVVLNLAISLARHGGGRVVVVDAHSGRPAVAEGLGLRGRPGLAEVLAGTESLEHALQPTGVAGLTALAAGEVELARSLRALGETCRPVLRQLRDRFDVVLIDGADPEGAPEAAALAAACDAVFLVVTRDDAEAPATDGRVRALLRQGIPVRGCIVTEPG